MTVEGNGLNSETECLSPEPKETLPDAELWRPTDKQLEYNFGDDDEVEHRPLDP